LRGREIDIYYDRRDISVIYLFLEGVLVGEAYCTEVLGRRLSIWEAQAAHRTEAEQVAQAASVSRAARQRIQQEAQAARTTRSRESRRLERQRQLDRQRSEIHPAYVLDRLAALEPPPSERIALPKAEPDPDLDGPIPRLPIREHGEDVL
jgi:hypothetical protein